ncbi:MAG TPA: hypothetical protein VK835_06130 [Bacteroidia bacterium]|nr:hypothetical protein [Bacteroidia bacterium]
MKSLKIMVLALCVLVINVAWAQTTPKTAEEIATQKTEELTNQLGLSGQQKKEAYQLYLYNMQQMEATRAKFKNDVTSIREADQQSNKTLIESINKILTAEQKAKHEKEAQRKKSPLHQTNVEVSK